MTVCFYHGVDLDGWSSAATLNYLHLQSEKIKDKMITYHGVNYGSDWPINEIKEGEEVIFLDLAPTDVEMLDKNLNKTDNLTIIDHHQTSKKRFEGHEDRFNGIIADTSPSACVLTYTYYADCDITQVPWFLTVTSDYDTWTHNIPWNSDFYTGMVLNEANDINNSIWFSLFHSSYAPLKSNRIEDIDEFSRSIVQDGKKINKYLKRSNAEYLKSFHYEAVFEGHPCLVCNRGMASSHLFESLFDPEKHDFMIAYVFNGKGYVVSLYTPKKDILVNKIAVKYGGGGHPGAAGFTWTEKVLPWHR